MNLVTSIRNARDYVNHKQAVFGTALLLSPIGAALAQAGEDPGATAVTEITKGKGYGIAAAVALVAALWAISAVYMARRKG